jgi:hypothetical protein
VTAVKLGVTILEPRHSYPLHSRFFVSLDSFYQLGVGVHVVGNEPGEGKCMKAVAAETRVTAFLGVEDSDLIYLSS